MYLANKRNWFRTGLSMHGCYIWILQTQCNPSLYSIFTWYDFPFFVSLWSYQQHCLRIREVPKYLFIALYWFCYNFHTVVESGIVVIVPIAQSERSRSRRCSELAVWRSFQFEETIMWLRTRAWKRIVLFKAV